MKSTRLFSLAACLFFSVALASPLLLASNAKEKQTVKPYPLAVCLVTDNDLDSMGDPVSLVHEGQEVKFCCKPCIKKFQRNPARYLAKLEPQATPSPAPANPSHP